MSCAQSKIKKEEAYATATKNTKASLNTSFVATATSSTSAAANSLYSRNDSLVTQSE